MRYDRGVLSQEVFTRRTVQVLWLTALFVLLAAIAIYTFEILLLFFASALFGIFLNGMAQVVRRYVPVSEAMALTIVLILIVLLFAVGMMNLFPILYEQFRQLFYTEPTPLEKIRNLLPAAIGEQVNNYTLRRFMPDFQIVWGKAAPIIGSLFTGIVSFFIVFTIGVYFAYRPHSYREGFLRLIPPARRSRIRHLLREITVKMQWWLIARGVGMIIIGILTTLGLLVIQIPFAFLLGALAGLLNFIPNLGPILSVVPALLLAMAEDPNKLIWVAALYLGTQVLETYFLTPLVEQQALQMPPVLIIFSQLLMGSLFGLIGLFVASPLMAITLVVIQSLYVEDVLEKRLVKRSDHVGLHPTKSLGK